MQKKAAVLAMKAGAHLHLLIAADGFECSLQGAYLGRQKINFSRCRFFAAVYLLLIPPAASLGAPCDISTRYVQFCSLKVCKSQYTLLEWYSKVS